MNLDERWPLPVLQPEAVRNCRQRALALWWHHVIDAKRPTVKPCRFHHWQFNVREHNDDT